MEEVCEIEIVNTRGANTVIDVEISVPNAVEERAQMEPIQSEKNGTRKEEESPKSVRPDCLKNLIHSLNNLHDTQPFTIFRLPTYLRDKSKNMYEPRMVSIGPFYHGREELRAMEEHKQRFLRDLLNRNTERSIEDYFQEMRKLEMQARQCYSERVKMDGDQFALVLLLDGCFILEYFLKWRDLEFDAFSKADWKMMAIELILLGNQIPFFVVHKLAFLLSDPIYHPNCDDKCSLLDLIFPALCKLKISRKADISCDQVDHLLHFYYKCMVPEFDIDQINLQRIQPSSMKTKLLSWLWSWLPLQSRKKSSMNVFPCATVLNESGITFMRKKNPRDMFDTTFHDGVIDMPVLNIEEPTKIVFTNVMAFEQSQRQQSYTAKMTTFTSFANLMDTLIDTKDDVALLCRHGIIESLLQSDEEAAVFFNQLCGGSFMDYKNHYYKDLFMQVFQYSNSTWPRYRARLLHDYFSNPWTSVSVFAGVTLLGLTVTQTYYTIYSAYRH